MPTYRGAFSGSGKDPIPAKGKSSVEGPLLSGDFDQSKFVDYAGGRSAKNNKDLDQFLHGDDPNPTPKA